MFIYFMIIFDYKHNVLGSPVDPPVFDGAAITEIQANLSKRAVLSLPLRQQPPVYRHLDEGQYYSWI